MTPLAEPLRPIRTLVVTRWVPFPPLGGAAMRNWQTINLLKAFGPVDVFAAVRRPFIPAHITHPEAVARLHIEPIEDDAAQETRTSRFSLPIWLRPFVFERRVITAFDRFLAEARPDLVVVEELALAPIVLARRRDSRPLIYDAHNVESRLWQDILTGKPRFGLRSRIWLHRIQATERRLARRCTRIWVCSTHDQATFAADVEARRPIDVVHNGLSSAFYSEPPASAGPAPAATGSAATGSRATGPAAARDFVFLGTYTYQPNEVAAKILIEEILPRLQQRLPAARLLLVGRGARPWMTVAARQQPGVVVTGEVEDVRPFLHAATAMIVPLTIGSGTRLKILEAFASRCPVISTAKGAEGLGAVDGSHLLSAETAEEFVDQIERLVREPALARALSENAYELFARVFSWEAIGASVCHSVRAAVPGIAFAEPSARDQAAEGSGTRRPVPGGKCR